MAEHDPEPCAFIVLGGTGDLMRRKLVPALYHLAKARRLPTPFALLGLSRKALSRERYLEELRRGLESFSRSSPIDEEVWRELAEGVEYLAGAFDDPATYAALARRLEEIGQRGGPKNRVFYLAAPPDSFPTILRSLGGAGLLNEEPEGSWARVVIEKPFGRDLASARALNRLVAEVVAERQIFRIDHYLGKETIQNLLVLRFANAIFEPLWNRQHIDHIEITAAEEIGVAGRGRFYDQTGALRDMVQSHLLQVLSLCAMEIPGSFAADDIRDAKNQVLRALRPISEVSREAVRGQYEGYRQEPGVDPASKTPTYAALKVMIDNWRWQGVPFYLRSGKRLAAKLTEIVVSFRAIPFCLFGREACQRISPNLLRLRIQPDPGAALRVEVKVPGEELEVGDALMGFQFQETFVRQEREAYERLLLDVLRGDATLFARRDTVEESWAFLSPVLEAWEEAPDDPPLYAPGSSGPKEAEALLARDGRRWTPLEGGA